MSARFVQLKIAGFKSFADPVSVDILPGLTGIVGPNGCGKSNVVEALRWAMGETSARSLRGGEMDDLIFAGTASRPARNLAEVTLSLENARGLGPGPFAEQDDLQISRRAERGSGSDYRLNGRPIRARDVQTLFADLSSGARSSAMVSQGRVAMLVGARPEERRTILEEAAGITGLHARRHEAELKLRATETNLTRAEDLRTQLESRLEGLTGQSEQASRYRQLSAGLREAEIALLALLHARARSQVEQAKQAMFAARQALSAAEEAAETAVLADYEAGKALPPFREAAETARTALERCRVSAEGVAREEQRAAEVAEAAATRLKQCEADRDAAALRLKDASDTLERLKAEAEDIATRRRMLPEQQTEAAQAFDKARQAVSEAATELEKQTAAAAAARAEAEQARTALETAETRFSRLKQAHDELAASIAALRSDLPDDTVLTEAEEHLRTAGETLTRCQTEEEEAAAHSSATQLAFSIAGNTASATRTRHEECSAALTAATTRLATLTRDRDALIRRQQEAETALVPEETRASLLAAVTKAEAALTTATATFEAAETERAEAAAALMQARARMQEDSTTRAAAAEAVRKAEDTLRRAEKEAATLKQELDTALSSAVPDAELEDARSRRTTAEKELAGAESSLEEADTARTLAATDARTAQDALSALKAELARLHAQVDGLTQALGASDDTESAAPVADLLQVPDGLDAAVAAALSEGLDAPEASASPDATRAWLAPLPALSRALPGGAVPLSSLIAAPDVLRRALSQAGLVDTAETGAALLPALEAGQCLVTRDGALWRWDGYHVAAGQPGPAALRLAQRRTLRESQSELDTLATTEAGVAQKAADAATALTGAETAVQTARSRRAAAETALGQARSTEADVSRRHAAAQARLDGVRPQYERAESALKAATEGLADAQKARTALPDASSLQTAAETTSRRDRDAAQAEATAREARRQATRALEEARRRQQETESRHNTVTTRLETILPDLARLTEEREAAGLAVHAAEAALKEATDPAAAAQALTEARKAASDAEQKLHQARKATETARAEQTRLAASFRTLQEKTLELKTRLSALEPRLTSLKDELQEATDALEAARAAAASSGSEDAAEQVRTLREKLDELRLEEEIAREQRATLVSSESTLTSQAEALTASLAEWTQREDVARQQLTAADERLKAVQAEHTTMSALPEEARRLRESSATALSEAETAFLEADAARQAAETRVRDAQENRQKTASDLATARENLLRSEGKNEQAQAILAQLLAETPEPPLAPAGDLTEATETGLRRKITRLNREREELGPVNLRADLEAQEAEQQIATIRREHEELEAAIARLRGSVSALNKEGRERLMAVFTRVDQHFQSLFSRMFGGGRAHLGLVGSDDPLQAGLEIYAQPPGKKLATLSLLSGGEQALTALSLIFAVFRCTPAPVCVLDEVDAPLDDANVGRFCSLLSDMAEEAGTRFLVVTHHQLTMAHMDRLYGVTMQERGVSRVLSVDLERASAMAGERKKDEAHA